MGYFLAALVLGLVSTGCLVKPVEPAADPRAEADARPPRWVFSGNLTGATVASTGPTFETGFHQFEVPQGRWSMTLEVTWEGTSTEGIRLELWRGDGTPVAQLDARQSPAHLELAAGTFPSGEGGLSVHPPESGVSVGIHYTATLALGDK